MALRSLAPIVVAAFDIPLFVIASAVAALLLLLLLLLLFGRLPAERIVRGLFALRLAVAHAIIGSLLWNYVVRPIVNKQKTYI
ncbi:hypothetical protein SAMN06295879_3712 [Agreia bicolorata]|uniref:Uncharacterized protein n=1 Tax=Agreia bicolorata TaxID=110935 RepID=A0A1T4YNV8_9MICO|nr:hypothetical protein [Agreia bicolorata]SKB03373.1 hypothetical protein SAMN06295879_3712 [Agreia bicolorata]